MIHTMDIAPCIYYSGIFTSTFLERYPARYVCMTGGVLYFISQIMSSLAPDVYLLLFTHGILIGNYSYQLKLTGFTLFVYCVHFCLCVIMPLFFTFSCKYNRNNDRFIIVIVRAQSHISEQENYPII